MQFFLSPRPRGSPLARGEKDIDSPLQRGVTNSDLRGVFFLSPRTRGTPHMRERRGGFVQNPMY